MRVGLVTWAELPGLSDDDLVLVPALEAVGVRAEPIVWSDPAVTWEAYDALVIRSTWDYHLRLGEFLAWVGDVANTTRLWNLSDTVRWNCRKDYLRALRDRGVPVIPTEFGKDLADALSRWDRLQWPRAVVKASVSAGGWRTYLLAADRPLPGELTEAPPPGPVLVQPYLDEVERLGERSLVFLGGEYSHAFLRAPRLAPSSRLVEGTPHRATPEEIRLAAAALDASPGPTLYARVDLVPARGEGGCVMELELVEPFLGLKTAARAPERMARALARSLKA